MFVYASMDAPLSERSASPEDRDSDDRVRENDISRSVKSLNVYSNVPSVVTGIGLTGGNIEF